jgi:hypothetical protein
MPRRCWDDARWHVLVVNDHETSSCLLSGLIGSARHFRHIRRAHCSIERGSSQVPPISAEPVLQTTRLLSELEQPPHEGRAGTTLALVGADVHLIDVQPRFAGEWLPFDASRGDAERCATFVYALVAGEEDRILLFKVR